MTAAGSATTALLDQLDALHAAATPGPWQYDPAEPDSVWDGQKRWPSIIAVTRYPREHHADDAALIVAAVNALPDLVATVRAVLALVNEYDSDGNQVYAWDVADRLRASVTTALGGTQ